MTTVVFVTLSVLLTLLAVAAAAFVFGLRRWRGQRAPATDVMGRLPETHVVAEAQAVYATLPVMRCPQAYTDVGGALIEPLDVRVRQQYEIVADPCGEPSLTE